MNVVSEAVILMAGSGSRLRDPDQTLKPLIPLLDRPLVSYAIDALAVAGVTKIHAVVGFESDRLSSAVRRLIPAGIDIHFISNPEWQKSNGISLLAAKGQVAAPFLLTMSDHLFDTAILDLLIHSADIDLLNLAIDRRIDSIFDLDDAMKVQTIGDRIVSIGKDLQTYDAIDTGLFACPASIFDYLERARRNRVGNDCSLAAGVRLMAEDGKVRGIDIGEAWWQDVDTPQMLQEAKRRMLALRELKQTRV